MGQQFGSSRGSKWIATIIVLALLLSTTSAAFAAAADTFVIDHFDSFQSLAITLPATTGVSSVADASILGGERDIYGVITAGPAGEVLNATVNNAGNSRVAVTSGVDIQYTMEIQYDGSADATKENVDATVGLGGIDLTLGGTRDRLFIGIPFTDLGAPVRVRFYSSPTSCTQRSFIPGSVNSLNPKVFEYTLSTTGGTVAMCSGASAHATFTSIRAIVIQIDAASLTYASTDMAFHLVGTTRLNYMDYGDLPDDSTTYFYDTDYLGNTGAGVFARHIVLGSVLGSAASNISEESTKRPTVNVLADSDTLDDGVVRTANWTSGAGGGPLNITVSNCATTCYVTAFIDWNQDGDFWDGGTSNWDANERVLIDQPVVNGANAITLDVPIAINEVSLHARFRLSDENLSGLGSAWGTSYSGEVEDYYWTYGPNAVTLNNLEATAAAQNNTAALVLAATVVVALGLAGVALRRRTA